MNIYGPMTISGIPKPDGALEMLHKFAAKSLAKVSIREMGSIDLHNLPPTAQCTVENKTNLAGFDIGEVPAAKTQINAVIHVERLAYLFWTFANMTCLKTPDAGRTMEDGAVSGRVRHHQSLVMERAFPFSQPCHRRRIRTRMGLLYF